MQFNFTADQCLCFCYMDSTIPILPKSKVYSVAAQADLCKADLCQSWLETLKNCFLTSQLICDAFKN